jgi:HlyD family secretion protein
LLLGAAGAGGYYYWQQRQAAEAAAAAAAVRQATVTRGTIVSTVSASGYLAAQELANLYFSASSTLPIVEVRVELGDAVQAGQVLARLDDAELQMMAAKAEQELEAAQLRLELLQAPPRPEDLAVAEANIRVAQNQVYAASLGATAEEVEIARLNLVLSQNALNQTYATMERLEEQGRFDQKNALQRQADQQVEAAQVANLRYQAAQEAPGYGQTAVALASVEQAEAALAQLLAGPAQEDIEIATIQVRQAEAALEAVRSDLEKLVIVAPFDGVVAAVNLQVGERARPAVPAIVLADVSAFYLEVLVDEVDVALVSPGQAVTITLDALPNLALAARVEKIAPSPEVAAGLVNYPVRLSLLPTEAVLRGGLTATAAVVVDELSEVLLVPNWAIRRDRETGQAYVGLLRNGVVQDVPVTLGERDEEFSAVLAGVNEGDIVAVTEARDTFNLLGD